MSVYEKYELVEPVGNGVELARHRRLGRLVSLRSFSTSEPRGSRVRQVVSRIADLDHPVIPHLVDVIESDESLHLATEAQADEHSTAQVDLLDQMSVLGQVSDALSHAHQRDVAHGRLVQSSIGFDAMGNPRLVGLGMNQCEHAGIEADELKELRAKDLVDLRAIIRDTVDRHSAEARLASELEFGELDRLMAKPYSDVSQWHPAFQAWLQRQLSLREARRLAVSDVEVEPEDRSSLSSFFVVATASGIVLLVALGILTALIWPGKADSGVSEGDPVTAENTLSRSEEVSSLQNVGVINNAEQAAPETAKVNVPSPQVLLDRSPEAISEKPSDDEAEPTGDVDDHVMVEEADVVASEVDDSALDETALAEGRVEDQGSISEMVETTGDAFAQLPAMVELPPVSQTEILELGNIQLGVDQNVELTLMGGVGACKQGEFRLRGNSNGSWMAEYRTKNERTDVAAFGIADSQLRFRWLNADEEQAAEFAAHLRNTKLRIQVGSELHDIALRKPKMLPPFKFALEGTRQINLELDAPPAWTDVVVELIESDKSLLKASPQPKMSALDAQMMVGLDAGRKSLVMLKIESLSRGRLRTTGWFRPSVSAKRKKIKKGFERNLRKSNSQLNQQLFNLKNAVSMIKGKGTADTKKAMQTQVKRLEKRVENAEKFWESFLTAKMSALELRVYRQLGEDKLMLMEFVSEETP